mgnify:CR=1 FL=1
MPECHINIALLPLLKSKQSVTPANLYKQSNNKATGTKELIAAAEENNNKARCTKQFIAAAEENDSRK